MHFINTIIFLALTLLPQASQSPASGTAKESQWKQIFILQSTRADVERLLGPSKSHGYIIDYPLKEGSREFNW